MDHLDSNGGQQVPQPVQPYPVECSFQVAGADTVAGPRVALIVSHPAGQGVYYMEPETARMIAKAIEQIAAMLSGGIVVPPSDEVQRFTKREE